MTNVVERDAAERDTEDGLTVGATAKLVGVTVRTLHHWDEIGLASPSARTFAGYRLYSDEDVLRLHRIVAYRESGLGLDAVREVLDDGSAEIGATLREQRAQLAARFRELEQLDHRLGRMAEAHERGILLRARDTEGPTEDAARFVLREAAAAEAAAAGGGGGGS